MDLQKSLGFIEHSDWSNKERDEKVIQYINLKLTALGKPDFKTGKDVDFLEVVKPLLSNYQEKNKLLANCLCPADQRIQDFLESYFKDELQNEKIRIPIQTMILDRHGLSRMMSIPPDKDSFVSDIVQSYRVKQGVIHNPKHDRRTTKGVFHVVEGGLPIPADKIAVPKITFVKMMQVALNPPSELARLPFTASQEEQAELFVSLLLRPMVCPEVPGYSPQKSLEVRFFAPGSLVSNLDFVESIFGNAGDPYLPENDAALDVEHWTGHTGCVILAPHLIRLKKKDLGLPHYDDATERQRKDGVCWTEEDELYNDGGAFKLTCRDERGVIVTLIADNYFGYCKKEVKTQISYSSNLYGLSEEEHAGGAIAFQSYDLGEKFSLDSSLPQNNLKFSDIVERYGSIMNVYPEGYGIDKKYNSITYVPEDAEFNLGDLSITWKAKGQKQKIKLLAFHTYVLPSGYKIKLEKQMGGRHWRLTGAVAEGTLCHKPCTVSGGGKSEISKSIADAMIQGPIFVSDFHKDMELVGEIMNKDFGDRFKKAYPNKRPSRPILSSKRSLGSVIKLFTPSSEYSDDYNLWLNSLPPHLKDIIYVIKRHYRPEWGEDWRSHFNVDRINGALGHELKYENNKLVANYLRVGNHPDDGAWRIYKLRQDYNPADKIQVEDDISASVVIPSDKLHYLNPNYKNKSVKIVKNCEYRLFQRPDDCIHRGYDKQAEKDLSSPGTFLSNFEPMNLEQAKEIVQDAVGFDRYTEPVKKLILDFIHDKAPSYFSSPAHPRLVDGKPTKNPRYLQDRPDIVDPMPSYLADVTTRFFRTAPLEAPIHFPVNAVLPGRRNNPPDPENGIPPLAVYNPIHYQELPELFMDFICSVTGKSPSTTGFGSEGALTKGPFNALLPITDLNNALVSYILTEYDGFSSAAGYVGPKIKVDHDISLLIPEVWCRMTVKERDPKFLIKKGYLEKMNDFDHNGKTVQASLLGYRITIRFVHAFLGRIFNNPDAVFSQEMLAPEKQDMDIFAQGVESIVVTQQRVAQNYFEDGSYESACPPLKALLSIMKNGEFKGKTLTDPSIRKLFTRESLLTSDWYKERIKTKVTREIALWEKSVESLKQVIARIDTEDAKTLGLFEKKDYAEKKLKEVSSEEFYKSLHGTLGTDPLTKQLQTA